MKNITHYFSDGLKSADNSSIAIIKEVKVERAEIDEKVVVAAAAGNEEVLKKKKRNRVKIKISKPHEGTICDIVESTTDLVDKTPSPYHRSKSKKRQIIPDSDTPNQNGNSSKSTLETNMLSKNVKKKKKEGESDGGNNKSLNDFAKQNNLNCSTTNYDTREAAPKCEHRQIDDSLRQEYVRNGQKQTEKLTELADKRGYSKRKAIEEDKAVEIEKQLEKRKKYFTEPCKKSELMGNDENSLKYTEITPIKRPRNLLNYFSKVTPEQLKRAKLLNAKVTVKAEVHIPLNSPVSCSMNKKNIKSPIKKKAKSHSKHSQQELDEIQVIQSETVVSSPKNEKVILPFEANKPKWSLKIQLLSQNNFLASDTLIEEDIYTPTTVQKENIKQNNKIPKILLPLKSKKADLSNTSLEGSKNKPQEKNGLNSSSNKKIKNGDTENFDRPVLDQFKVQCAVLNKSNRNGDSQIIENNFLKRSSKEKVAPLFTKKVKPDPQVTAARRLFLQSDVEQNNINNKKQRSMPVAPIILPFPTISHVKQYIDNNISNRRYNFKIKTDAKLKTNFNLLLMKTITILDDVEEVSENLYESKKTNIQTILSEIETYCPDVQRLWKSISILSKSEKISRRITKIKKTTTERIGNKQTLDSFQNEFLNSQWTDKYKPKTCAEIVGNEEAALKLKTWLSSWKSFKSREDYSSSEEFYTSDCSTSSSMENNQVAVLIGPHGIGKTASVYAVAQELGYKVIEVNASSKRPGKKILKDFEEATKSHRVKKTNIKDAFATKPKKTEEIKKISQNSLILMEDVDLVFEEDEGFVSAVFQLTSNTKRPIVMTLRDACSYLSKLAPQQLRIYFQPVVGNRVSALMQLISLSEKGCKLSQNCIDAISASGDLRQGILQLQYFLLSNIEQFSNISMAVNYLTWKEMCTYIYKPLVKAEKNKIKNSNKNIKYYIFSKLNKNIESFILMSDLLHVQDPTSYLFDLKYEPSISLIENTNQYSNNENTSLEIGNWLSHAIKKSVSKSSKQKVLNHVDTSYFQLKTKNQTNKVIDSVMSQITSYTLDRRALAVDYLSSIRTICRAEEVRNQVNSKRGNRFFHYLQNSRLSSGSSRSDNILFAACKILFEKSLLLEN